MLRRDCSHRSRRPQPKFAQKLKYNGWFIIENHANASSITAEVKRAQGQEVELAAAIKINEDKITAEVTRASEAEGVLSGKIEVTATKIRSEVSASLKAWNIDGYDINYYGFGNPRYLPCIIQI